MHHDERQSPFDQSCSKNSGRYWGILRITLFKLGNDLLPPKPKRPITYLAEFLGERFERLDRERAPISAPSNSVLNKVKGRADIVGIFPNEGATIRLVGAVLLEANDEWQLQHRYMQTEAMAELIPPLIDAVPTQISIVAA